MTSGVNSIPQNHEGVQGITEIPALARMGFQFVGSLVIQ